MLENRNTILAVILSGLVLIAWQFFYNVPQMEKRKLAEQAQSELAKPAQPASNSATPQGGASPAPWRSPPPPRRRSSAMSRSPPRRASRSTPRASPAASR
jgi:YidC/Oxa1 family membrane protein insertase